MSSTKMGVTLQVLILECKHVAFQMKPKKKQRVFLKNCARYNII
jgi:hypothetical protein